MSLTPEQVYCDMVSELAYTCPDAPTDIIERAMIRSMRRLAVETCALQTSLMPPLEDCVADYELSTLLPDSYEICKIMCVNYCGCCIQHIEKCVTCPTGYEMKTHSCIVLHPEPNCPNPDDLEVQVAIRPCLDLAEVPEELMKHDQLIQDMTLRTLLGTPKQDYTDIRLALNMDRKIQGGIIEVMCQVQNNYTNEGIKAGERVI